MPHLDEEQGQRFRHRELAAAEEASVREHLAQCAACRERGTLAEREEDELHALLRHVDHAPPRVTADAVVARARRPAFTWVRKAAGVVLALGVAGVAYAAPGSPLPALVAELSRRLAGRQDELPPVPALDTAPTPAAGVSGIAVDPGPRLFILFTSRQTEGQVHITLSDGAEVVVRAPIGAATFSSSVDRLVIDNQGAPATYEMQIPRAAPRVEIRVSGVRIFLKDGRRIIAPASEDARGDYRLSLSPGGP